MALGVVGLVRLLPIVFFSIAAGAVAQWLGAPAPVVTGGPGCLVATAWIAAATAALRTYRRSFIDADERARLRSVV